MRKKILLTIFLLLLVCGCNTKKEEENVQEETGFYEVASYLEKKDGWIYMLYLEYSKSGSLNEAHFTGYNMKYDEIDDYYIPMVDDKGNLVEKLKPKIVGIINDQEHIDEFDAINDYLNKNLWKREITEEDLKDLRINYYHKEDIINLYNETIKKDYKRNMGKFDYCIDFIKNDKGYQVAILGDYGYIDKIRIDKKENNTYLSDIVLSTSPSEKQKKLYQTIKEIEKQVIKSQNTNIDNFRGRISDEDFESINEILQQIKHD